MKESASYVKIVECSEEDHCFVGTCPGLRYGGCHGGHELAVFEELCAAVDEAIDLDKRHRKPLPPPTSGRDYATRMLSVAQAALSSVTPAVRELSAPRTELPPTPHVWSLAVT